MSNHAHVLNTTAENFARDVFEQSKQRPVIVDFWAEWCAPCRMLAPILEELADEFAGKIVVVKAETEQVPDEAARFNVQGIPAVYGVCNGEIVDFFSGALPKTQVKQWIERLLEHWEFVEAKQLETSQPTVAEAIYRRLQTKFPQASEPAIGLARALLAQDRRDDCRAVIAELQRRGFLESEAERVRAALELREAGGADVGGADVATLRRDAAARPQDFATRLKLSEALAATQEYEPALEALLALVREDRNGTGERAKQLMVDIFRVLPDGSDVVREYRRKLSAALY